MVVSNRAVIGNQISLTDVDAACTVCRTLADDAVRKDRASIGRGRIKIHTRVTGGEIFLSVKSLEFQRAG